MAYVIHPNQLSQLFKDAKAENPNVDPEVLIAYILQNPDIEIMKSSKVWDTESIIDWAAWLNEAERDDLLAEAFDVKIDSVWNIQDKSDEPELTKEEKIDYSNKWDTNEYKGIRDKWMKNYDITNPAIDNLKIIANTYDALLKEKDKITSKYDSWLWQDKEVYQQKLKAINDALEYAENSQELWEALWVIKENWMSDWDRAFARKTKSIINDMVKHRWSQMNNWNNQFSNWLYWDYRNSGFARFIDPTSDILYSAYEYDYNKKQKENNNKWEDTHWTDTKDNSQKDNKKENKENDFIEKLKGKEETTDKMSFGDDISKSSDPQWYLEKRNKRLAMHLWLNWIRTEEDIDKYLSQYPSYKNAKQEWRDNTKKVLNAKVNNIKSIGPVKKEDVKKSEEINDKDVKWAINENKKKDDTLLYDKNWNAVWSKWVPSNDDSINWVEDEYIYDKNWNKVWSKAKTEKKTEKKKEEKKKETPKFLGNSPVINGLLNINKK